MDGEGWSLQRPAERYGCDAETVRTYFKHAGAAAVMTRVARVYRHALNG